MPGARTILVPLDGTFESEAILPAVAVLAREEGAVIRLMRTSAMPSAVEVRDRIFVYADQEADRIESEARGDLGVLAGRISGVRTATVVRFGEPVAEIVAEAESSGAGLIAMATHEHPALGWSRRNHLARAVAHTTRIPVLRVPCVPRGAGLVRNRGARLAAAGGL